MSDRSEKLMKHSNKILCLTEDKLKLVADVLKDDFSELDLTVGQHSICVTYLSDNRIEYVTSVLIGSLKNSDFRLSRVIGDDLRSMTVNSYNRLRLDFNQIDFNFRYSSNEI